MTKEIVLRICSILLGLLLIVQISTINISLPLSPQSYGVIKQSVNTALTYSFFSKQSAQLATSTTESNAVLFVGDVLLARNIESLMLKNGVTYPFLGIDTSSFPSSWSVVGNFESAVPKKHQPTSAGELRFSVNEEMLPSLKQAGFTHVSLANNHSFDFGTDDFIHTNQVLIDTGLVSFGHPKKVDDSSVAFLEIGKSVIALIGIHTLFTIPPDKTLTALFSYVSARSDIQVAYVHWGTEYDEQNDLTQRLFAEKLVAFGADLIVGHHPHVVQNVDLIEGVPVFYSLGNFIFDQYFSVETEQGLTLQLHLTPEPALYLFPVSSQEKISQPRLMDEDNRIAFLQRLAERSDSRLTQDIKHGIVPLYNLVATSSKIAMIIE